MTENGEVYVEDQFIGRLEGFRFLLDPTADADQARTLRAAGVAALAPALSLRADKFYNAPDTEIDVTEQGGLMWGEYAVGKLVAGADPLSPQVQPFVDEDARARDRREGPPPARPLDRPQDRALFQPLIALRDDEALTGMARGIAFRLVEALGVLPRSEIADEVKGLDQESRASLRKHGVRFGQYTVFLPLLLKPAPTRLRLVLWSLAEKLQVFPEAPPPGLVTVAAVPDAPPGYYPRAGYRLAGERAIRIDMLERLADMIRNLDARARLRGDARNAVDHRPVARAVREADAGHGLRRDRGDAAEAQAAARRPPARGGLRRGAGDGPAAATPRARPARARTSLSPIGRDVPVPQPQEVPARAGPAGAGPPRTGTPRAGRAVSPPDESAAGRTFPARTAGRTSPKSGRRAEADAPPDATAATAAGAPEEMEVFYLFIRGPRRRPERPRASPSASRATRRAPSPSRAARREGKPRHGDGGSRKPRPRSARSSRRRHARRGLKSRSTRTIPSPR